MGKMVLTVLGLVAEMELGFIKARQHDGIERAKSKGDVYRGRKTALSCLDGARRSRVFLRRCV
jgi:DNA invertase Pin-like site-specific DNA recombinase